MLFIGLTLVVYHAVGSVAAARLVLDSSVLGAACAGILLNAAQDSYQPIFTHSRKGK